MTNEHILRIYALRDQLDALDKEESARRKLYEEMRAQIEQEIEAEGEQPEEDTTDAPD